MAKVVRTIEEIEALMDQAVTQRHDPKQHPNQQAYAGAVDDALLWLTDLDQPNPLGDEEDDDA